MDTSSALSSIDGDTLRSTTLDTWIILILGGGGLIFFGSMTLIFASNLGHALSYPSHQNLGIYAVLFMISLCLITYMTAYFPSASIFKVTFDGNGISYRDAFGNHTMEARAINSICFVDSVKNQRYIVIHSAECVKTLPNMLWSQTDFTRLREGFEAWRTARKLNFPITNDDSSSPKTVRGFFLGSRQLPNFFLRHIPICAAICSGLSFPALLVAYFL